MEENKKKKKWEKPCLTIIVRGRIEENVLGTCRPGIKSNGEPYYTSSS